MQLDAHFGERDDSAIGKRRLTRWNKYKFGRSTPPRSLLLSVERTFAGTLDVYDHALWDFLGPARHSSSELHALVKRLPPAASELFVEPGVSDAHPFWLHMSFDHEAVLARLAESLVKSKIGPYDALAAFLAVADDGLLRQIEVQHVDAHAVIGWQALSARARDAGTISPDVFIHVFDRWLSTEYTSEELRDLVNGLRPPAQSAVEPPRIDALFAESRRNRVQVERGQHAYRAAAMLLKMRTQSAE